MQNLVVTWAIAFILFQGILTEGENIVVIPSTLGDLITGNATSGKTNIYIYNISLDHVPMIDAYINLQKNVSVPYKEFHLSVNAWSYGATVSWSLPLTLFGYPFLFSKKLLCPANYVSDGLKTTPLYVSISSASPVPIPYRLKATYENYGSFIVHPDAEVKAKVSPTHPTIFQIDFGNLTAVDITFTSPDPYCGVALVQNASCPIVTSLDEMKLGDARITFTTDAYLHLENTSFAVVSDKCYYNFRCLRSGAGIVAFNHFSAALLPYLIFGISIGAFTCYRMRCDFRLSLISVEFALLMIFESLSASMFSFCPNRHTAGYGNYGAVFVLFFGMHASLENMFIFLALSFLIARRTGFSVESHSLHYVLTFLAFAVLLPTFWLSDNAQSRVIYAFLLVVVLVFYGMGS
ncbi:unnamed protein product [Soboliphyme baturini]|uniref:Transmembrane 9 superfamily member n=1 Tax=Soboliphyme baturini TaxID=241478 RepID=A0A183IJ44_9BILA|nr:unnamed protein product [Soboliphyme baturini]